MWLKFQFTTADDRYSHSYIVRPNCVVQVMACCRGCVLSTVATDTLVPENQALGIHSAKCSERVLYRIIICIMTNIANWIYPVVWGLIRDGVMLEIILSLLIATVTSINPHNPSIFIWKWLGCLMLQSETNFWALISNHNCKETVIPHSRLYICAYYDTH